jgi:hypothetical protein
VKTGQALPVVAGWFLEQQSEELPFCDSQQQSSGRAQQQQWFSGCLSCREHSSVPELADGNLLGESKKSPALFR